MTAQALILQGSDTREEFRRWGLAAAFVCAAHFGLLAGYAFMPSEEPDGASESPAVLVDLAPTPPSPPSTENVAPGLDTPEVPPMAKSREEVEPQVTEPIPKIEAPAEVTLPLPDPKAVEKKPEKNPEKSETTPLEDNTPAPQQLPSPGAIASRASSIATWRSLVQKKIKSAQRYPARASARNEQGTVTVAFVLNRNGIVLSRNVVRSSGYAELDQEALAMVARAAPFPPIPASITGEALTLPIPIEFKLH